jgi:hypothetical protein
MEDKEIILYSTKMESLFQVDANNKICIVLAARLGIALPTMATFFKNQERHRNA